MNKVQWLSIIVSVVLVLLLFFAFDTKPKAQKDLEKSRILMAESADVQVLLQEAKSTLSVEDGSEVLRLETELELALTDSVKSSLYKELSGEWYRIGNYPLAGHYAQQVADLDQTEESWSIAGTTYFVGIRGGKSEKERKFSAERAVQAFENAISINPESTSHKVNLALVYTELPPEDNPMKGIQMLLGLNQEEPENVLVLVTLARLAVRTGQWDRAEERLLKALELDPGNGAAICLLADVYPEKGAAEKAAAYAEQCKQLSGK